MVGGRGSAQFLNGARTITVAVETVRDSSTARKAKGKQQPMVFCSCSFLAYYLLTAVVSYVAIHIVQVVLDLPLWEGQQQHHSPSDQHFELKRLIQKILEEIGKLPELLNHSGLPLRPEEHLPYFDPKKYEQLLATAVLNKVVDDYRNPKNFTDGGDVAGKSAGAAKPYGTVDINHNQLTETAGQQGLLGEETLRQMSVAADEGVHPHDGVSYTASGDRRLSDDTDESYLSDYIQRHKVPLPDLSDTTGSGSGAEDDDLQSLKSNATDGTWEENWLFRKRQLKTTESSIAMLVPSPTEEVKALIGDKNADEISDLSEAGSDCEGYESDGVANGSGKDSTSAPTEGPPVAVLALASSSKDTSEDISCSSKTHDSLEEHLAPDSLVSVNSLPVTEEALLETRNSQLLAEQSQGLLVDDLISIGPVADKVETTNPFLGDAFEANNNVITDDVKLLQRTEAGDSRGSASELSPANGYGDRKEIPIDRDRFEHPEVSQPLLLLQSLSPPGSPVQPVLSPHPIMMTITDVFDRLANSSPLTAISEEQPPALLLDVTDTEPANEASSTPAETSLEAITEEPEPIQRSQPVVTHADSMQTEPDDSEYRTISEATNDGLMMVESFDALESLDESEPPNESSLLAQEEEFCSLVEQADSDRTSETSPDLLHIRETPPAAIYMRNHDQLEFAEQLKTLDDTNLSLEKDPFEGDEEVRQPAQITLQADLVTFDNNAPSPDTPPAIAAVTEQMRAYCEELKGLLNRPVEEPKGNGQLNELESEQWEMVESPEALEALAAFQDELLIAVDDPTQSEARPCKDHVIRDEPYPEEGFPSPVEVVGLQMADYSNSLKNIEYVEEADVLDEETVPLLDSSIEAEEAPMLPASNGDGQEQDQELSLDLPDTLIPGSIAEREHLKWRNAKPIANNPYSPDALQRRLSEKSRPTSMIEIDRLVRKEVAPVAVDDEDPPKEPTDSGTENDRSLQSVMGGVLAETKKIGREYYINDPERLRSGGAPVKQTLGPSQQQQQQAQLSHSTDDEKVSHQTYYTLPADSYIMDRFLNNAPASGTGTRCSTVGRSPSTRSIRSLPQHELAASGALHRAASVDLGYQTKTPSAAGSDTAVDIPAHILAQFEQETLHSDYKRDSFRARHATTRQFVLNPIFDEQQSSPGPEGTGDERTWTRPAATLPRKSATAATAGAGSAAAARTSSGAVVETVFTDLGTLRRSASVKSRIEQFSGPFPAIRRTDSYRSTLSNPNAGVPMPWSLLLGRNVDDNGPGDPAAASSLYRSSSFGRQRDPDSEDIFVARPIQVTADDPILKQGTKVTYLSTPAREVYLVPLESEPNGSLLSTSCSDVSGNSPNRPELDSLTYSEDSDVTRIYDLTTGEAKLVRAGETTALPRAYLPEAEACDTILKILPQVPPSPVKPADTSQPVATPGGVAAVKTQLASSDRSSEERAYLRPAPFPVKPLSPETIKFFAPKPKPSFTGSPGSLVSDTARASASLEPGTTHVLPSMHSSLHIDFPASRAATGSEFAIIERDVIGVLPSVKELAKCYSGSTTDVSAMPPKALYKPRDFIRQSSDVLNEEGMPSAGTKGQRQYCSTSSIAVRDEIREIRKLNLDAYRQSTYYPMAPGHSITARSLSKQIREHKSNVTDDHKVGQQEVAEPLPRGDDNGDGEVGAGHASPERPSSPVFLPGHLKSRVASLARSFSRISFKEGTTNAALPVAALKTTSYSNVKQTVQSELLPFHPVQARPTAGSFEIGNSIRRHPLIPLKEIIDIPLVSRIIESPVQRPGPVGPIGDNLTLIPSLDLPADIVPKDEHGKQAARLIVIRRRKMRKHKLKKLRKRMKFEWLKVRQRRELKKEKLFQAELVNQIKEAEKFSAEAYVASKLRQATEVPLPRFHKGKRLPQFIIKQKLGLE
uniref:Ribosomal protein mS38 C-terminal domain-containing protein n=1 Tax=Anopheles dirus TaxID=7168 RepID=A0A182NJF2_9DIPT